MIPIPAAALAALTGPAARPMRAEWSNDGDTWTPVPRVASGEVRIDAGSECRYSGTADLIGVPLGRSGINTAITRVRLWQGLQPPRTEVTWVPAGTYVVDHVARTRLGANLELLGLEDVLRGARLPVARTIGPDTARVLVEQLAGEALPGVPVSWRPGVRPDTRIPRTTVDEDRWQALVDIAAALAGSVWVDARGVLTIGPTPTLDDPAVWRIPYGTAVVEPAEEQTAEDLVNLWTVSGDGGDGAPVIGPVFAWDSDPRSITYAGPDPVGDPGAPQRLGLGHVRVRAQRYTSPLITTTPQADDVAQSRLAASLGVQTTLAFTAVGHPGLEPGDVVEVEVRAGEWQRHIIDSCPYTLGGITQSCTTRTTSRRLT
ncbi:phage tail protein [Streptomyces sp. NPDC057509]|uniref:phage tail protein n=1 Tax=Streptomyces sp. NPDC057509 TaxID=3346152 RepID=UPI0036836B29